MDLTKDEVILIRLVGLSRSGLHIYTIFRRSGLAAPEIAEVMSKLKNDGLIRLAEDVASLTKRGQHLVKLHPQLLVPAQTALMSRVEKSISRSSTEEFKGASIGINAFYVPRTSELPKSLLFKIDAAQKSG